MRLRQAEHQYARRAIAEPLQIGFEVFLSQLQGRRRAADIERLGGGGLDAQRGQGICSAKLCARRCSGVNQRAVRCEDGERFVIAEQAADTLGKRQRRSRRLGRRDQDRGLAVRNNEARAGAGERAAEAKPESAQAFEARRTGRWQRGGEADNLRGGRVVGVEAALHAFTRIGGAKQRRAGRIRPQHPRGIGAPQPSGPWARRRRRKSRITQ